MAQASRPLPLTPPRDRPTHLPYRRTPRRHPPDLTPSPLQTRHLPQSATSRRPPRPTPLPTPLTRSPSPTRRTLPPPGRGRPPGADPASTRAPTSDHLQMDRLGGYATLGLTAMYAAAEGAGFDATSHRMPSEALFVTTECGADSLVHRPCKGSLPGATTSRSSAWPPSPTRYDAEFDALERAAAAVRHAHGRPRRRQSLSSDPRPLRPSSYARSTPPPPSPPPAPVAPSRHSTHSASAPAWSSGHAPELVALDDIFDDELRRTAVLPPRRLARLVHRRRRQGKVFPRHLHGARDVGLGVGRAEAA